MTENKLQHCYLFLYLWKLREEMLEILLSVVQDVPPTTPMEVEVVARCLTAVWAKDTDLSTSSQVKSCFMRKLITNSCIESLDQLT